MKYVLLFCGTKEDQRRREAMSEAEIGQALARVGEWFDKHGSKVHGSERLQPPTAATTVRFDGDRRPIITDGPFIEGNDVVGGYALIDVEDLDEALRIASDWPAGPVEVRPVWVM